MSHPLKLSSFLPPGRPRSMVLSLVKGTSRPDRWEGVGMGFDDLLDGFERFQIAAMVARLRGAYPERIDGLLEAHGIEVLHTLLGRMPPDLAAALEPRLDNGLLVFHHHVVRELARRADDASEVFAASGACQLAAIGLDAEVRRLHGSVDPIAALLDARDAALADVRAGAPVDGLPMGGLTLALIWVATLARLGRERLEDETTEHYAV